MSDETVDFISQLVKSGRIHSSCPTMSHCFWNDAGRGCFAGFWGETSQLVEKCRTEEETSSSQSSDSWSCIVSDVTDVSPILRQKNHSMDYRMCSSFPFIFLSISSPFLLDSLPVPPRFPRPYFASSTSLLFLFAVCNWPSRLSPLEPFTSHSTPVKISEMFWRLCVIDFPRHQHIHLTARTELTQSTYIQNTAHNTTDTQSSQHSTAHKHKYNRTNATHMHTHINTQSHARTHWSFWCRIFLSLSRIDGLLYIWWTTWDDDRRETSHSTRR